MSGPELKEYGIKSALLRKNGMIYHVTEGTVLFGAPESSKQFSDYLKISEGKIPEAK